MDKRKIDPERYKVPVKRYQMDTSYDQSKTEDESKISNETTDDAPEEVNSKINCILTLLY